MKPVTANLANTVDAARDALRRSYPDRGIEPNLMQGTEKPGSIDVRATQTLELTDGDREIIEITVRIRRVPRVHALSEEPFV